jgi:hypothetical protein
MRGAQSPDSSSMPQGQHEHRWSSEFGSVGGIAHTSNTYSPPVRRSLERRQRGAGGSPAPPPRTRRRRRCRAAAGCGRPRPRTPRAPGRGRARPGSPSGPRPGIAGRWRPGGPSPGGRWRPPLRVPLGGGSEPLCLGLLEQAGVPSPAGQVGVAAEELERVVADRRLHRVGEQQAGRPAQQAREVLGPALPPRPLSPGSGPR